MTSFGWFKHKQKSLEFAQQHLELKIHFESKLILIQCLDEEDWIKSMYTQYITNIFQWPQGLMFVIYETLPNKRKLEK
jgi:hypothetical protein